MDIREKLSCFTKEDLIERLVTLSLTHDVLNLLDNTTESTHQSRSDPIIEKKELYLPDGQESRLSKADSLWAQMENFYSGCGPSAWIEGQAFPNPAASVPNYMTSNAFIAWQYACIAIAAARDLSQSNQHGVLNVIELGSGIGKFSFLFLTKLQEMSEYAPKTREGTCAIRLIITDCIEENLNYCKNHAKFQPFINNQMLDFALFDARVDSVIVLQYSGETLGNSVDSSTAPPILVIANYVLDSLPLDGFRINQFGIIEEALVTVHSLPDQQSQKPSGNVSWSWKIVERHSDDGLEKSSLESYYSEDWLNRILCQYIDELTPAAVNAYNLFGTKLPFLFPVSSIQMLERLRNSFSGIIFLVGDKGFSHVTEFLQYPEEPHIEWHGCFSVMVNFHAISHYIRTVCTPECTTLLQPVRQDTEFSVWIYGIDIPSVHLSELKWTNQITVRHFSPTDFLALENTLSTQETSDDVDELTLENMDQNTKQLLRQHFRLGVSLLRLAEADPNLFDRLAPILKQSSFVVDATDLANIEREKSRYIQLKF